MKAPLKKVRGELGAAQRRGIPRPTETCEMRREQRAAMEPSCGTTAFSTRAEISRQARPSSASEADLPVLLTLPVCHEDLCRSCRGHRV